jgi:hypothetical protein
MMANALQCLFEAIAIACEYFAAEMVVQLSSLASV